MKIVGNPPEWATELFKAVCKDYNRGLPSEFIWRNRNGWYSSGTTRPQWGKIRVKLKNGNYKYVNFYGGVTVRAGTDVDDQKHVLLHELAHHVLGRTKRGRRAGHSIAFWKLAFEMYQRYGIDLETAHEREKHYKKKATQAYEYHLGLKTQGATV